MPETSEAVKDLAKELEESAHRIKSSIKAVFGIGDKTPPHHEDNRHYKHEYDLAQNLAALSLRGRGPGDHNNDNRTPVHPEFVGDFDAELLRLPSPYDTPPYRAPNRNAESNVTIPSSLIPGFSGGRSAVPPLAIPHPEDGQSLTMQYALSKLGTDYRLYPDSGVKAPSRPHSTSVLPGPDFGLTISAQDVPVTPTRRKNGPVRSSSTPSSPTATSTTGGTQCAGVTKAGKRCTRVVKSGVALLHVSPDAEVERFCHQHAKEILNPTGFYSHKTGDDWVEFKDWIPDYLQPDTQVALRTEMEKVRSAADVPGYIYTFEIRDPRSPNKVELKVGRAVNLVKRIDQWGKQCGSKEQVLRGWWPGTVEHDEGGTNSGSLMKGRVMAGAKGPCCHRLERLVHLELADLSIHAPYLDPGHSENMAISGKGSRTSVARKMLRKPCEDCGQMHQEIFVFTRVESGRYAGKEWELIVKPVIEKWGSFVERFV